MALSEAQASILRTLADHGQLKTDLIVRRSERSKRSIGQTLPHLFSSDHIRTIKSRSAAYDLYEITPKGRRELLRYEVTRPKSAATKEVAEEQNIEVKDTPTTTFEATDLKGTPEVMDDASPARTADSVNFDEQLDAPEQTDGDDLNDDAEESTDADEQDS